MKHHELAVLWVDALASCKDPKYVDALYKEALNSITNLHDEVRKELEENEKA